jgi:hypothetical protein
MLAMRCVQALCSWKGILDRNASKSVILSKVTSIYGHTSTQAGRQAGIQVRRQAGRQAGMSANVRMSATCAWSVCMQ